MEVEVTQVAEASEVTQVAVTLISILLSALVLIIGFMGGLLVKVLTNIHSILKDLTGQIASVDKFLSTTAHQVKEIEENKIPIIHDRITGLKKEVKEIRGTHETHKEKCYERFYKNSNNTDK